MNTHSCRKAGTAAGLVVNLIVAAAFAVEEPAHADDVLLNPDTLTERAPESYRAKFETSKGVFLVEVTRRWAPRGADRFYNLVKHGFYDNTRFFEVLPGVMVQFGLNSDPALNTVWKDARIRDDRARIKNGMGTIAFAAGGPRTRATQIFINLKDNTRFFEGFRKVPPFGRVVQGMEVLATLQGNRMKPDPQARNWKIGGAVAEPLEYGEILIGNEYLDERYPHLDTLIKVTIVFGGDAMNVLSLSAYSGPRRPDNEVATLQVPRDIWLIIRNDDSSPQGWRKVRGDAYSMVKLPPGERDLSWGRDFDNQPYCARAVVDLERGGVYVLGFEGRRRGLWGDSVRMWLENPVSGEVLAGSKPRGKQRSGQIDPPLSFRWMVDHNWFDECVSGTGASVKHPKVLMRREKIIALGDMVLASPISRSTALDELMTVATVNEEIPARGCPEAIDEAKLSEECRVFRASCRAFIATVEEKARRGSLYEEAASRLITTARELLSDFGGELEMP